MVDLLFSFFLFFLYCFLIFIIKNYVAYINLFIYLIFIVFFLGPVKPSNDIKLKFYSYYKQATEGPCELPKPGFWDIVNRAKWYVKTILQ